MTRLTATSAFISSSRVGRRGAQRAALSPPGMANLCTRNQRRQDPHPGPGRGRSTSAGGAGAPEHVAGATVVDPAAEHEKVVGEAVQVFERLGVHRLRAGELAYEALGPPGHGAREMEIGGSRCAAWQDERVERSQCLVHRVDLALETLDLSRDDAQCAGSAPAVLWCAQIRAEVE